MTTDRSIISEQCWSQYEINRRIWFYGQYLMADQYQVSPQNIDAYKAIVNALTENEKDTSKNNCLVIMGPSGTGKSTLTKIISKITYPLNHPKRYRFVTAQEISTEFSKLGHSALKKYSLGSWVFDDVGREDKTGIGGSFKTYNVMDMVLDAIHQNVCRGLARFIISTNDNREVLSTKYSPQVISRLNQVCEYVAISGEDFRTNKKILTIFPEVLHPVRESKQLELSPEQKENIKQHQQAIHKKLSEVADKFTTTQANQKRDPEKTLKPTTFEQEIWEWFDREWMTQGNKLMHGNSGQAVITYENEVHTRDSITRLAMQYAQVKTQEPTT